jgi:hypothetical protein
LPSTSFFESRAPAATGVARSDSRKIALFATDNSQEAKKLS